MSHSHTYSPVFPFPFTPSSSTFPLAPDLPKEALDFREYYLRPYYRPKHVYYPFGYPPGWKGGYGTRFYPKEYRYLVE